MIQEGRQNLLKEFRQKGFFDVQVETETQVRPDGVSVFYRIMKGSARKSKMLRLQETSILTNTNWRNT